MKTIVATYIFTAIVFLGLDAVWLRIMSSRLYKPALQGLLAETVRLAPALLFYLLYIAGIVVFAVMPAATPGQALWRGAGLGLVAYATYDLTNQATLRVWPVMVTVADLTWGMLVTGIAAGAAFAACRVLLLR
ncbi:membrane protein [Gluconacetobacter liquefaciens]|uniref:DUF2177 family protein n=1 Tax=Gluconacetobacter liquefaciens TaxID=89584 RepID=A0A370G2Z8_GLULI|nr:DUF2177 family protein [Gluconacetobacter liquefaciens]MBB2186990.1 DUF2177 family protein [Gluconacetobacter liquefaciens]RDI36964.1 putative membrane protein [Gluconacetobacter liquefaciens]GBQ97333.1 hypothetical protein AA0522_0941 [Gluconacetobacter liquefaciens NRIC 0522]GEB38776.1 membrane protein [Gluconacetobacter liquefaciens]